jgi:hypothetical protein
MNTTIHAVEVPFPQAFTGLAPRLFPSAPRYSLFLASSDRQSDREVGMRPPRRSYAAYHHFAYEQFDTLVLLPGGTIYARTPKHYSVVSVRESCAFRLRLMVSWLWQKYSALLEGCQYGSIVA